MMQRQYRGVQVLLVEDNPMDVELAMRAFRKHNLANEVHVCRDGEEAIRWLFDDSREELPRLILLDVQLPKIGGLEVLERIRADERFIGTPVAMMTTSREDRDIQVAYRLGANSYVLKPVDFTQFVDVVNQMGMYWLVVNEPGHSAA